MKSLDALRIVVTPSMSDLSTVLKQAELLCADWVAG